MPKRDAIDVMLTVAGFLALGALVITWLGHSRLNAVGGPLGVNGPLRVRGNLYVGGPTTVHGTIQARKLTVGGPISTSLPMGERPGPEGRVFEKSLAVGGPLTVQGPLTVDGALVVGGPLVSESVPQ
jgi:hypothetical protein